MTVAEINALLYSPDHPRDRLERALRIEALSPGWRCVVRGVAAEPIGRRGRRQRGARAGSRRASGCARISAARGDGDRSGVRGRPVADDAERGRPAAARRPCPASTWSCAFSASAGGPPLFRSYSLSGPLSTRALSDQREDRAEWGGRNLPAGACPGRRCSRRQLAARKLHSAVRTSGRWCCSARGSGRRRCWRCCTRWRRPARHGRSCGCTRLAIGEHHPFAAEVRRLMLALTHGRSYVCYSRPGSGDKMAEDFDATGHLSRSVFDEVGVPPRRGCLPLRADSLHGGHESRRSQPSAWRRSGFTSKSSTAASR